MVGLCDFFVSTVGEDKNIGTDYIHALKTLSCAMNPNCNAGIKSGAVICLLVGTYGIEKTLTPQIASEATLTIKTLGQAQSVTLDGKLKQHIFNGGSHLMNFEGIRFVNGSGSSGGAFYGERNARFVDCAFENNVASIHGGAVMTGRNVEFINCIFKDNHASFGGAVRTSV